MVVLTSTAGAGAGDPVEGVIIQTPSTKLFLEETEVGTATLYVTEHNVIWSGGVANDGGPAPTISLTYPQISVHAVQRIPTACLYFMLDFELRLPGIPPQAQIPANDDTDEGASSDDDYDPDNRPYSSLRFVPPDENVLMSLYTAISQGQALHPDPEDPVPVLGDGMQDGDDAYDPQEDDEAYMDGEEFEDDEEFEDAEESEANPNDVAEDLGALNLNQPNGNLNGNHHSENGFDTDGDLE